MQSGDERPVDLHTFGGLAGQLSGLAYGLWIAEFARRPVRINFHTGGVSYRPLVIEDLLSSDSVRSRVAFRVVDDFVATHSGERKLTSKQRTVSLRVARRLTYSFAVVQRAIEVRLGIRIIQQHVDRTSLRRVSKRTRVVRGYPTDWNVVDDVIGLLRTAISETGRSNFLLDAGSQESIAVHWRLGDYVSSSSANKFHGVISLKSILSAVADLDAASVLPVTIFTDSPEIASEAISHASSSRCIEIKSGTIWNDMYEMSRSRHFIGSHSGVSLWVATAISQCNPSSKTLLPDRWFASDYNGFDHASQVEGRFATYPVAFSNP